MKGLEVLLQLIDEAVAGVERGQVEDLLTAQYAVYGIAQGASPIRSTTDQKVVLLCEYCLESLSHGNRDEEWETVKVLTELKRSITAQLKQGIPACEMTEILDVVV